MPRPLSRVLPGPGEWGGDCLGLYKSFNTLCNKQPSFLSRRFTKGRWAGGGKQVAPPTLEGIARDGSGGGDCLGLYKSFNTLCLLHTTSSRLPLVGGSLRGAGPGAGSWLPRPRSREFPQTGEGGTDGASINYSILSDKQPSPPSRRFTKGRWAGGGKQVALPTLEGIARDGRGGGLPGPL